MRDAACKVGGWKTSDPVRLESQSRVVRTLSSIAEASPGRAGLSGISKGWTASPGTRHPVMVGEDLRFLLCGSLRGFPFHLRLSLGSSATLSHIQALAHLILHPSKRGTL